MFASPTGYHAHIFQFSFINFGVYSTNSSKMIGNLRAVLNLNRLWPKLNQFICNWLPVLPDYSLEAQVSWSENMLHPVSYEVPLSSCSSGDLSWVSLLDTWVSWADFLVSLQCATLVLQCTKDAPYPRFAIIVSHLPTFVFSLFCHKFVLGYIILHGALFLCNELVGHVFIFCELPPSSSQAPL